VAKAAGRSGPYHRRGLQPLRGRVAGGDILGRGGLCKSTREIPGLTPPASQRFPGRRRHSQDSGRGSGCFPGRAGLTEPSPRRRQCRSRAFGVRGPCLSPETAALRDSAPSSNHKGARSAPAPGNGAVRGVGAGFFVFFCFVWNAPNRHTLVYFRLV
jgi:hypothetical protein